MVFLVLKVGWLCVVLAVAACCFSQDSIVSHEQSTNIQAQVKSLEAQLKSGAAAAPKAAPKVFWIESMCLVVLGGYVAFLFLYDIFKKCSCL